MVDAGSAVGWIGHLRLLSATNAESVFEELGFRIDLIEHQLAHAVKDPLDCAKNHTKYVNERTEMMQRWADHLDQLWRGRWKGIP